MSQQAAAALSKLLGNIAKYSVALGVAGGALQASMYTGKPFCLTGKCWEDILVLSETGNQREMYNQKTGRGGFVKFGWVVGLDD